PSASSSLCRWPVADIVQCGPDDSKALKISRLRDQKNHIPQVVDFIDLTELARRAGLELGGSLEVFDLAHPARQWVPCGENLGHHLQVVYSKRLKSPPHSADRTAVTTCLVQRSPERCVSYRAPPSELAGLWRRPRRCGSAALTGGR